MDDFVTITWLPGADYKIYHIKFCDTIKMGYDIAKIDAVSFKSLEEAQIHCDMMGYKLIQVVDYSKELIKEVTEIKRKTGFTFKI